MARIEAQRGRGFQLLELLIMTVVLAVAATVMVPSLLRLSSARRVDLAAAEVAGALRLTRALAVRRGARVGVKFRVEDEGRVTFTRYRDGDGDGVRTRDIEAGTDPPLGPSRDLVHMGRDVGFGFPPGPPPRDPGDPRRRLDRLDDPIRFNRSDIASFSPLGESTPGSVYLTDGRACLAVVRLFGRTGKVKVLVYDPKSEIWR